MPTPRVLILRAPGTNCDRETAFAFEKAGGRTDLVHINRLLEDPASARPVSSAVPAGRIQLWRRYRRRTNPGQPDPASPAGDAGQTFKAAGKLILGICNGFQILIKSGVLLPDEPQRGPPATLTWNDTAKFEDRWVHLAATPGPCVFLRGIEQMYLPIAHAEGKFVARDTAALESAAGSAATGSALLRSDRQGAGRRPAISGQP